MRSCLWSLKKDQLAAVRKRFKDVDDLEGFVHANGYAGTTPWTAAGYARSELNSSTSRWSVASVSKMWMIWRDLSTLTGIAGHRRGLSRPTRRSRVLITYINCGRLWEKMVGARRPLSLSLFSMT
ncbi:hypothetical protein CRG98_019317 [Punica granatum]|uniref:Uncharacterized protein n=1 Tax=Punica granatum TaxID=22663 RepID=A0A2I0JVI1_PUNGR|nr:hypothetical protein CRG98_019317 [Punica granatum]